MIALLKNIIDFIAMCFIFPLVSVVLIGYGLIWLICKIIKRVAVCLIGQIVKYEMKRMIEGEKEGKISKAIDIVFLVGFEY